MADCMTFPKMWEQFLHDYEFEDSRRIYTNGSRLIPSFRVKQMMEHYLLEAKTEAIKEVAEIIFDLFPADKDFTTISRFTIKQKLKEMTEVSDAKQIVSLLKEDERRHRELNPIKDYPSYLDRPKEQ